MEPLPSELNQPASKPENASTLIKRFSAGAVTGLIIAVIQISVYLYFVDASISLIKGMGFCLGLAIICGLMTLKWGYKTLESLLQLLS
jgi:hypothetical protein